MKRITAYVLALVLTCFCVSSVAGAYYADVPGSSALAGEVEKAVRYGLMNGYSQAQFGYSVSCCADPHVGMADSVDGGS